MKIKVEIDIPDADYACIVKWLKSHGAVGTLQDIFTRELEMTVTKWRPKARRHCETGMNAYERFKDSIGEGND